MTWKTPGLLGLAIAALLVLSACSDPVGPKGDGPEKITYVIETDPLAPQDQQKQFVLPEGFKIELFASEPQITKPINFAFDDRGRLWVTQSSEYPVAAPLGQGKDKVSILEDTDGDGKADKVTDFADNLNIPIGVLPVQGGAIVYSIPHIYFLPDRNGDDKADGEQILVRDFQYEDTHGMVNSLVRGYDGMVYASHGFRNESNVTGADGRKVSIISGSHFRFDVNGRRLERTTSGFVNPFGSSLDRNGYLYSADCHTSPLYQLIEGGEYPGFGAGHSGLGHAPIMMRHTHGPTAIAGLVVYEAEQFPKEFRGNTFVGNVVSNAIKRDAITFIGATPQAEPRPDFLTSKDPWFRPVDLELGPDGALYVADFYNAIIGHYEVPLDHPRRDRTRGRIWRITYVGDGATPAPSPGARDFTNMDQRALIEALGEANLTVRMMATNQLSDRIGKAAAPELQKIVLDDTKPETTRIHGMWALQRMGALPDATLARLMQDGYWTLRLHANQLVGQRSSLSPQLAAVLKRQIADADPRVRRAAYEAMGRHPLSADLEGMIDQLSALSPADTHLRHVARLSLRNQLQHPSVVERVLRSEWSTKQSHELAEIFTAVPTEASGRFLWAHIQKNPETSEAVIRYAAHAARHGPPQLAERIAGFARQRFPDEPHVQFALFHALGEGVAANGRNLPQSVVDWGVGAAAAMLERLPTKREAAWRHGPLKDLYPTLENSWTLKNLAGPNGSVRALAAEEWSVGAAQSPVFDAPATLKFTMWGGGGDGHDKTDNVVSMVRLRAADGDAVLETEPLLADDRVEVSWNLRKHRGKRVYLEIVDGAPDDTAPAGAYQMIAVGGFEPAVVELPEAAPPEVSKLVSFAAQAAARLKSERLAPPLAEAVKHDWIDPAGRLEAARAVATIDPERYAGVLSDVFKSLAADDTLREGLAGVLGRSGQPIAADTLIAALPSEGVYKIQLAQALADSALGRERLIAAAADGRISPRLLQERSVATPFLRGASPEQKRRLETLVAQLPPVDEARQQLVAARTASFVEWDADMKHGAAVFAQNCSACHAIDGTGGAIGPQLDGIGRWGAGRLIEKILDPNRAMNEGFRIYEITFKDGRVETAMIRREQGERITLADPTGKEYTVQRNDIQSRAPSEVTLMPDYFAETIPEDDFTDLVAYLLSKQ